MFVVSYTVPYDLAPVTRLVAFAEDAGFFFGRTSSSWERPQRKTANDTTQTETTNTQSPISQDGPPKLADAAAPGARILTIDWGQKDILYFLLEQVIRLIFFHNSNLYTRIPCI
jgi:hypothetical protein